MKYIHQIKVLVLVFLVFALTINLFAETSTTPEKGKFGLGFQSTFPSYGISAMFNITNEFSLQGILGFLGNLNTYAGRVIYRFSSDEYYDIYGYGMLGAWSYTGSAETTETVFGFGAGAGIEYDWRGFSPKFPPLFWNIEIGFGIVSFEEVDYDFSAFMIGAGVHYYF